VSCCGVLLIVDRLMLLGVVVEVERFRPRQLRASQRIDQASTRGALSSQNEQNAPRPTGYATSCICIQHHNVRLTPSHQKELRSHRLERWLWGYKTCRFFIQALAAGRRRCARR